MIKGLSSRVDPLINKIILFVEASSLGVIADPQ